MGELKAWNNFWINLIINRNLYLNLQLLWNKLWIWHLSNFYCNSKWALWLDPEQYKSCYKPDESKFRKSFKPEEQKFRDWWERNSSVRMSDFLYFCYLVKQHGVWLRKIILSRQRNLLCFLAFCFLTLSFIDFFRYHFILFSNIFLFDWVVQSLDYEKWLWNSDF